MRSALAISQTRNREFACARLNPQVVHRDRVWLAEHHRSLAGLDFKSKCLERDSRKVESRGSTSKFELQVDRDGVAEVEVPLGILDRAQVRKTDVVVSILDGRKFYIEAPAVSTDAILEVRYDSIVFENDFSLEQVPVIRLTKLHAAERDIEGGDQFFLVFVFDFEEVAFADGEQDNRNHKGDC